MSQPDLARYEAMFLALADKTRLRLLGLMYEGPVSVGYLADTIGESQPKVSRHLAYLRNAGIVSTRRDGKWIYYWITKQDDADMDYVLEHVCRSLVRLRGDAVPDRDEQSENENGRADTEEYIDRSFPGNDDVQDGLEDDTFEPAGRGPEIEIFLL